jgi:anti-anti-sigma factor
MFLRAKQGAVDVIRGSDPLSGEHLDGLARVFDECIGHGQPRIVCDMQYVPLIDSAGLELLLDVRDRSLDRGGCVKLAGPNPLCRDILNATGVGLEFEVFDDVIEAAASFAL